MKDYPIIELLKTFSVDEILRFKKFLKSPYHNNRKIVFHLYNEIVYFYPKFNDEILTKEYLYDKTIKKGNYNDNTLRSLLSVLDKLAYDFLVFENLKDRDDSYSNIVLRELNKRNVSHPFIHFINRINKRERKAKKIDVNFLYEKYFHDANIINYSRLHDKFINSKNKLKEHIPKFEQMAENLIIFAISTLISDFIPVLIYSHEFQFNVKNSISKIFINSLNPWKLYEKIKSNNPYSFLLNMHLKLIEAYDKIENDSFYFEYKNCVFENKEKITKGELELHLCCLMNLCSMKHDFRVNDVILNEEYELNMFSVKNALYINEKTKYLPSDLYRSVIILGLKLKDYKNIENFIEHYRKELQPVDRKNYHNFGRAFMRFAQKNYNEAIRYLVKVNVNHYILKYDMRNLLLKIYYEIDEYDKAFDLIHSYKEFLNTNTFATSEKKKLYSNFIKYYNSLISYKSGDFKIDIDYIFYKFEKEKQISDKEWLKDKFDLILPSVKSIKTVS